MGYILNAAELKIAFYSKSGQPVKFVKCEVIEMETGLIIRSFDLGGTHLTTISGVKLGKTYMVRYMQIAFLDDWIESVIRISSEDTRVSFAFPNDGIIVNPTLLNLQSLQIEVNNRDGDILKYNKNEICTAVLNDKRLKFEIA